MMKTDASRRNALKSLGIVSGLGLMGFPTKAKAENYSNATKGLPPLKITKVRAIVTCPDGIELVMVKVETNEPGLYGLGCATFRQRAHAVVAAIDKYLNDFCIGRDFDNIEDIWQAVYQSSYWRNGPVLNNALSGLDQAL
jgi:mannonate dehydratase